MEQELRARLVAAGIPPDRHDVAGLSRYFPPEFRIHEARLDEPMLAELLLCFLRHGVISVAQELDARAISRRGAGSHICHFYRTPDECLAFVPAFLAAGLEAGQRCAWVLPEWLTPDAARDAIRDAGLGDTLSDGRLLLFDQGELHEDASGAPRPAQDVIATWRSKELEARAAGFTGLRFCGDATARQRGDAEWSALVAYEHALGPAMSASNLVALCTFALGEVPPDRLAATLREHDCGVVHRRGAWDEIYAGDAAEAVLRALSEAP